MTLDTLRQPQRTKPYDRYQQNNNYDDISEGEADSDYRRPPSRGSENRDNVSSLLSSHYNKNRYTNAQDDNFIETLAQALNVHHLYLELPSFFGSTPIVIRFIHLLLFGLLYVWCGIRALHFALAIFVFYCLSRRSTSIQTTASDGISNCSSICGSKKNDDYKQPDIASSSDKLSATAL